MKWWAKITNVQNSNLQCDSSVTACLPSMHLGAIHIAAMYFIIIKPATHCWPLAPHCVCVCARALPGSTVFGLISPAISPPLTSLFPFSSPNPRQHPALLLSCEMTLSSCPVALAHCAQSAGTPRFVCKTLFLQLFTAREAVLISLCVRLKLIDAYWYCLWKEISLLWLPSTSNIVWVKLWT